MPSSQTTLVQTTCPYCGVGCGVDVSCQGEALNRTPVKVTGTPEHPANYGRLCIKGTHLLETNSLHGRLLQPHVGGRATTWDQATGKIADKINQVISQHGPDAVAFYVSGQLLTEDYYIANKLIKGFLGSANIDTNSRLCMSSAVAAYKRAFGEDLVPCCYEDIECTDLLILTGSNAAWAHPVLFQRMSRARLKNPAMKVVVIDPRATETADLATLHLPLKPGTDAYLFNGLLHYLFTNDLLDERFISEHTNGFNEALASARDWNPDSVAKVCNLSLAQVNQFYRLFGKSQSAITFFSMGINQSNSGVDKANAIINCHLASGKIGAPGSGPFSITGQPNAMGGREVGGLANMLAAHMDIENPAHREAVQTYWQSPTLCTKPGLKAVDMFSQMAAGKIKFVWIMATNPVVSMPDRRQVEKALQQCEMVVVSDMVSSNDTLAYADIALPATGWSEKNGTVTNSERRISRQRGIMPPPGEARHDWQALCNVAAKLGYGDRFDYNHVSEIFAEHAGLSAYKNNGQRLFNLAGLSSLNRAQYDRLAPIQWPLGQGDAAGSPRLFGNRQFATADGKARFVAITARLPTQQTCDRYPYILNSGRSRDQWHTMTRTGKASALLNHAAMATLAMHPQDMLDSGVSEGELVTLQSAGNTGNPVILPVAAQSGQRRGECFAPIHWSATWGSHITLGALYSSATDPISGQPETKHGAVSLVKTRYPVHGQIVFSDPIVFDKVTKQVEYWAKQPGQYVQSARVACHKNMHELAQSVMPLVPPTATYISRFTESSCSMLWLQDNQLVGVVWLSAQTAQSYAPIPLEWLDAIYDDCTVTNTGRINNLLNGIADAEFLQGPLVCSCFKVRQQRIVTAIEQGCNSVTALGSTLQCGTNCGSCKGELARLVNRHSRHSEASTTPTVNPILAGESA
ncbi:nitrate reductase [Salinimonas sediminis]|uniref:Nitrate reductase n=2 Tax=Salinimonas sediminis TaxID=2303538 RepID=A0A346NSK7_9ALTE|nr:nitrate reductase [Salinimonas sediminis]